MYKCDYCNKEFLLKQQKTNHHRWHLNPKHNNVKVEYFCNICNRKFNKSSLKTMHERYCDGSGLTKKEKLIIQKNKPKNVQNTKNKT
jgi:DNA-directed RNA polymerase subunit RPC12/RpoP